MSLTKVIPSMLVVPTSGVLGGANSVVNHSGSFIIGSNITSSAANTLFVNNISASGIIYGTTGGGGNINISNVNLLQSTLDSKLNTTGGIVSGNLTINGNLTATGTTTFTGSTVYTSTSALSVVNFGSGAALYVGQSGLGDIASFYDLDRGVEVLHVGGADGTFPNVGIKTSTPNKTLTVNGEISASGKIWGDGTGLTLPAPTGGALGGVKAGTNIAIAGDGTISSTPPIATASVLGGVKQGTNITIDANGVISAAAGGVTSVNTKTGAVTLTYTDVQAASATHTHSWTDIWGKPAIFSGNYADLLNKPTFGTAAALDVPGVGNATTSQVVKGDDSRLGDTRTPTDLSPSVYGSTGGNATTTYGFGSNTIQLRVNAKGQVSSLSAIPIAINTSNITAGTLAEARLPAFSGDISTAVGSSLTTLPTVNSTVGSFGSSSAIPTITVNGKGLVTQVTTNSFSVNNITGNLTVTGNISANGDIIAFASSDLLLKDNITNIPNSLEKLSKINGVSFTWNENQTTFHGRDIGVIAQEIEMVLPEIVVTRDTGYKAVKYEKIIALLIEAVKELKAEVDSLKLKL